MLQVHDSLAFDVLNARYKPDQQRDQMHSAEQRKQITFQQDDIYEDEIRSLEQQLLDCQKVSSSLQLCSLSVSTLFLA